ncbi:MAG: hypothetical protein D6744_08230 [Planctomycetota bacterium]|nr:MAG: hypothetical protein D6744_08230 [Planctomycetota bacterium]
MKCDDVRQVLGAYVDGALDADAQGEVATHLASCDACRAEAEALSTLVRNLSAAAEPVDTPRAALWEAIENRLDAAADDSESAQNPRVLLLSRRVLASAAAVVLVVGLGWLAARTPWEAPASAATVDFRPLLAQADGDIEAGINALLARHGGREIRLAEVARRMRLRIHAAATLPYNLKLKDTYLLNLGRDHQALAFHYAGPSGHLLLLQCPPMVRKNYGGHECMPCSIGVNRGEIARVGALRLAHFSSENVCVCVVSTLDEHEELPRVLGAVKIDY